MKNKDQYIHGRGAQLNPHNKFLSLSYEEDLNYTEYCYQNDELVSADKTQFIEVYPKSIVNKVDSPDVPFSWSINPYQGCEHGCIYCYARNSHEYWGYSAGKDFEQKILVKTHAPVLLKEKLQSKSWQAAPIMLSGNTDCYQPAERKLQITRKLLQVFLYHKHPVGIITKNALITRDIDLLSQLAEKQLVKVVLSITSLNEDLRQKLEPRTSSTQSKLKAIKALSSRGIPVSVMMAPIIPFLNSEEVFEIAKAVSKAGATHLNYTTVRLNGIISLLFEDWIYKNYPDRAEKVLNHIKDLHGGKLNNNEFGSRMRGTGAFAEQLNKMIKLAKKQYSLNGSELKFNLHSYIKKPTNQISLFT